MKLQIPIGSEINTADKNIIRIQIPNTRYWVQGERKQRNIWDLFLIDPQSTYKELIKENMTTKAFAILTNMTLKTPFPYPGKRATNSESIKKFVNKLIKINIYEYNNKDTSRKGSSLQVNRKRFSTSRTNLSKTVKSSTSRRACSRS